MPQTQSGTAQYTPLAYQEYQGIAYNEAETSLFADVARTQFNVDGTGVTMGVLSTSVNQYNGGLAASYATGDLNPNNPVNVLQDDPNAPTDEGRAMLENIHDIAPGANLQFATAFINELSFGQNIQALASAGSQIIVDDVGYADEPFFQPGLVSQGVDAVVAKGVTYFSAAGNEGPDSGYLSHVPGRERQYPRHRFRHVHELRPERVAQPHVADHHRDRERLDHVPVRPALPDAGAGRLAGRRYFERQYLHRGFAREMSLSAPAPTRTTSPPSSPGSSSRFPIAGQYFVAVQVVSGANPGHIEFAGFNDTNGAVTVSTQYGTTGGTSYPSSFGHASEVNTIGIGATPWWAPAPYLGPDSAGIRAL